MGVRQRAAGSCWGSCSWALAPRRAMLDPDQDGVNEISLGWVSNKGRLQRGRSQVGASRRRQHSHTVRSSPSTGIGSSSERRATTRQKDEMIEIRTAETEWSAIFHAETLSLQELRPAFLARRISDDRKDDDRRSLCGGLRGVYHREAA